MATKSIKQNNINFTVSNDFTDKNYAPFAGATFGPADLGRTFDLTMLKQAETEGWLDEIKVLHSLFIDWDGGKITLNGTTYTITNTGELLAAIQNANKVSTTLSNSSNMAISAATVYQKIQELESRLAQYESAYIGN